MLGGGLFPSRLLVIPSGGEGAGTPKAVQSFRSIQPPHPHLNQEWIQRTTTASCRPAVRVRETSKPLVLTAEEEWPLPSRTQGSSAARGRVLGSSVE